MGKHVVAFLLLSSALASAQPVAVEDAFSEIPVFRWQVPSLPDPQWTPPRIASAVYEFQRPRGLFGKATQACGTSEVAIHVSAKGEFVEARLHKSSGIEKFDDAALGYAAKGQVYSPAIVIGKPMNAWLLQRFKFENADVDCGPRPALAEVEPQSSDYNAAIKALLENAKARNVALQAEQQKALDEREQQRYAIEEPYRTRIPTGAPLERQALYAAELSHNLVHCGSSRYDRDENFITEYRDVHFYYKDADALGEIDLANGYEWRGRVGFYCKMQRFYGLPGAGESGWSDWERCGTSTTRVWKRRGKWRVENTEPRPKLTCADVPSE